MRSASSRPSRPPHLTAQIGQEIAPYLDNFHVVGNSIGLRRRVRVSMPRRSHRSSSRLGLLTLLKKRATRLRPIYKPGWMRQTHNQRVVYRTR